MLVMFQYLLSFALTERARLAKITSNLAALPNYTLSADKVRIMRDCIGEDLNEGSQLAHLTGKVAQRFEK